MATAPGGFGAPRLILQAHNLDLAQMAFGFPAPRPPRAGEPQPSSFLGRILFLRRVLPWAQLIPTKVPGTAGQVLGACRRRIAQTRAGLRCIVGEAWPGDPMLTLA